MDNNNQNMGQPMNPDMQYQNMGQDYTQQPQMNYTQQPQMNYTQQPQMQYQNMQQGYQQPQMQYQNMQQGYQRPQGPKKPLNKKAVMIAAAVAVVALLIIFIPKLFKPDTPFDKVRLGMSTKKVMETFNLTEDDFGMFGDTLYTDVKAFGVEGRLQLCLDYNEIKLENVNWYVDLEDCASEKEFKEAIKDIKDYYTKEYGKPDKDGDVYEWEAKNAEYELDVREDEFILRYR